MKYAKLFLVIALLSVILITGCTQQTGSNTSGEQENVYTPPVGVVPSIKIISPAQGDEITGSAVGVRVNVTNFRLADIKLNPVNRENEGHILYDIDGRRQQTPMTIVSFTNVAAGVHILKVQLMNNDKMPIEPPIIDVVTFTTK
jgi:hypothetical protein